MESADKKNIALGIIDTLINHKRIVVGYRDVIIYIGFCTIRVGVCPHAYLSQIKDHVCTASSESSQSTHDDAQSEQHSLQSEQSSGKLEPFEIRGSLRSNLRIVNAPDKIYHIVIRCIPEELTEESVTWLSNLMSRIATELKLIHKINLRITILDIPNIFKHLFRELYMMRL